MLVNKMLCDAEGAISAINSAAVSLCSTNGIATGDSTRGSSGSRGVIKCASTHCLGSSTSKIDNGLPGFFLSAIGACYKYKQTFRSLISSIKNLFFRILVNSLQFFLDLIFII